MPSLGGTWVPYQTLGPQTVTDYEIGLKADWAIGAVQGRTNISAYISKFKNLQTQAAGLPPNADGDGDNTNDPTNTALIVNAGSAKTKGVELDGFVRYEGFQFNYGLALRSEEHTSELQSLMRISYAVFCLKTKNTKNTPSKQSNMCKRNIKY